MSRLCLDPDFSPDEAEEKARLISQVKSNIQKVALHEMVFFYLLFFYFSLFPSSHKNRWKVFSVQLN